MDYFLEIFAKLPRAGPGSKASTTRAWDMMSGIPDEPRILDIGCGPGVQTIDLLQLSGGTVVALDLWPIMIERTIALAKAANLAKRLKPVRKDMNNMKFPPGSFDVIWSEGAIYNLGFARGLKKVKSFVRPGGSVAVSEVVWLRPDPPEPLKACWAEYPEIDTIENKVAVIERQGYQLQGHFVLPEDDWRTDYYDPMASLLAKKSIEWSGNAEAMQVVREARHEIQIFNEYLDYFGYAFFVMQSPVH